MEVKSHSEEIDEGFLRDHFQMTPEDFERADVDTQDMVHTFYRDFQVFGSSPDPEPPIQTELELMGLGQDEWDALPTYAKLGYLQRRHTKKLPWPILGHLIGQLPLGKVGFHWDIQGHFQTYSVRARVIDDAFPGVQRVNRGTAEFFHEVQMHIQAAKLGFAPRPIGMKVVSNDQGLIAFFGYESLGTMLSGRTHDEGFWSVVIESLPVTLSELHTQGILHGNLEHIGARIDIHDPHQFAIQFLNWSFSTIPDPQTRGPLWMFPDVAKAIHTCNKMYNHESKTPAQRKSFLNRLVQSFLSVYETMVPSFGLKLLREWDPDPEELDSWDVSPGAGMGERSMYTYFRFGHRHHPPRLTTEDGVEALVEQMQVQILS